MKISNYPKQTLSAFLRELGSASSAPGGGAAAGLSAAIGAALIEMVARLNGDWAAAKKAKAVKDRLQALMVQDAKAFACIYTLYKKKTSCCAPAYQAALARAAAAPEEICLLAARSLPLALSQKKRTSAWLLGDLKEAALLLNASFESARLSVNANLKGFHDHAAAKKINDRLSREHERLLKYGRKLLG